MQEVADRVELRDSQVQRQTMVDCQVRTFEVTDQRLLARLLEVPREHYLAPRFRDLAYSDVAFIDDGSGVASRHILPPMIVARLIQGGRVTRRDRVLDVAPSGGYSTAVLAGLAASVVAVDDTHERCRDLAAALAAAGLGGIQVIERALQQGVAEAAPYDVILVNGAVEGELEALLGQLAEGGRLLTIIVEANDPTGRAGKAVCYEKRNGVVGRRYLFNASAPALPAFKRASAFTF